MKATKKIVGAACALVAAVALSAGSTFAWFSSKGQVTASGMQVQTVVPTNLYIVEGIKTAATDFKMSTLDFKENSATTLKPVSVTEASGTVTGKVPTTWTKEPTPGTAGTPSGYEDVGSFTNTATTLTAAGSYTATDYLYVKHMSIMNKGDGEKTADLTLDVTVTVTVPASATTTKFLKCGILSAAGWKAMESGSGLEWQSDNTAKFSGAVTALKANVAQAVTFVVWYDGNDPDCFAENALSTENMSFSIEFSAVTTPSGAGS